MLSRILTACPAVALGAALLLAPLPAQDPAPLGDGGGPGVEFVRAGLDLLASEDPVGAWQVFRQALQAGATVEGELGLGKTHLMLGQSAFALAWAEAALRREPTSQDGMALCVRAMIRARQFDGAVQRATSFLARTAAPGAELEAAAASALFRVQRTDDAAVVYGRVLALDPLHAEGHLRLGSGLLPPRQVAIPTELAAAVAALGAGERERAIRLLQQVLAATPQHPIAHRLLGETLFAQKAAASIATTDPVFAALAAALPVPDVRRLPVAQFVVGYDQLPAPRARVVARTAAMFGRHLERLVAVGARHDLLRELERTTDAPERANLRGRRTFDGRVWDDVRGVGGVQAATGIEALDEAAGFGFDTLAHEIAHQVHYYALTRVQRARITALYKQALAAGRCLDFYAASNEAEYFGQGVEAFACLAKRPGGETTHGHTRFELWRVDRELHDLIAEVVDFDPLAMPSVRDRVLEAAIAVALRVGRPHDALAAAGMLGAGPARDRLLAAAERAVAAARCH